MGRGDNVTAVAAGLPDINGSFGAAGAPVSNENDRNTYPSVYSGAFDIKSGRLHWSGAHTHNTSATDEITFSAGKVNSIYGNSSTVQPPAITLIP